MKVTARRIEGFTHEVSNDRGHTITADEPREIGGNDRGARPTELLAMSLAACTAITVEMYADRKGIQLPRLEVDVEYALDPQAGHSDYRLVLKLPHGLTEDQVQRLRVIAGKCPVHRVLIGDAQIADRVEMLAD